jgi:dCTP deaminase
VSVLSTGDIRKRLAGAGEDRLVIAPLLDVQEQLRDPQCSIDVRLGCHFEIAEPTTEAIVDTFTPAGITPRKSIYRPLGDRIVLHPHQFVLGTTLEFVRLPPDLMAYVVGRSSWGREGLIVATAVGVHPGYAGIITLELRNLGELPISLYPGIAIAQLFLHSVSRTGEVAPPPGPGGQFGGSTAPARGSPTYSVTDQKLRELRRRYGPPQPSATLTSRELKSDEAP